MADDDILLDSKDLMEIFGIEEKTSDSEQDLIKTIEDIFSDDTDGDKLSLEGVAEAPELPPGPADAEEPPLVEPDRNGMTEEEWRASPEYAAFKQQVIERHLRKKAEEEAARRAAEERESEEAKRREWEEAERRKQELVEKYKAAKAASIAQRAQAIIQEQEASARSTAQDEQAKEEKFKAYLAGLKSKMRQGGMPALVRAAVPPPTSASLGLNLNVERCKQLAAMFEITREQLIVQVGEKIGRKAAQAMMKKTLAKVAKQHLDIYGRAAVTAKNELREDGALDIDRLSRAFYAVPEAQRVEKIRKALYELLEMRFIAVELGLGARTKGFVLGRTLDGMDKAFKKAGFDPILVKWYLSDVVPSTALSEGEEDSY